MIVRNLLQSEDNQVNNSEVFDKGGENELEQPD